MIWWRQCGKNMRQKRAMNRLTIEYMDTYAAKKLCTIDRFGGADDYHLCDYMNAEYCKEFNDGVDEEECRGCIIQECIEKLGQYENAHEKIEKRIQEIKANENYPHNYMGQIVDDFEWVLKLFEQ